MIDGTTPLPIAGQPPLVLVADDDPGISRLVALVIKRLDMRAVVANDGAAAVRLAAEHKLRLCGAILDIQMPRLGGIEAAHEIRQLAPALSIVLMSAAFPTHYEQRIVPLSIMHVLPKPFQLAELISLIRMFVAAP